MLAHISPDEAKLLKSRGGAGTKHPITGMPEFYRPDLGPADVGGRLTAPDQRDQPAQPTITRTAAGVADFVLPEPRPNQAPLRASPDWPNLGQWTARDTLGLAAGLLVPGAGLANTALQGIADLRHQHNMQNLGLMAMASGRPEWEGLDVTTYGAPTFETEQREQPEPWSYQETVPGEEPTPEEEQIRRMGGYYKTNPVTGAVEFIEVTEPVAKFPL